MTKYEENYQINTSRMIGHATAGIQIAIDRILVIKDQTHELKEILNHLTKTLSITETWWDVRGIDQFDASQVEAIYKFNKTITGNENNWKSDESAERRSQDKG